MSLAEEVPLNVAAALPRMAAADGGRPAVVLSKRGRDDEVISFTALETLTRQVASGLAARGVRRGDRVLLMVPPCADLIATVFALLELGAAPVLVDPGLGLRAMLACVRESAPRALVGIRAARILRRLAPGAFGSVQVEVGVARGKPWWQHDGARSGPDTEAVTSRPDDEAAIAFTSGSTGPPKGVVYRHRNFQAQVRAMIDGMGIAPGGVHLCAVPIFALFNPALGVTTVLPAMDPSRPARLDAGRFVATATRHRATFSVGSPTIWRLVCAYCERAGERLPDLREVFMFGAPAPLELVRRTAALLDEGTVFTPYGATEALPLTLVDHHELLDGAPRAADAGACVGRPLPDVRIRVVPLTDAALDRLPDAVPAGTRGEIVVSGPVVTDSYVARPEDDRRSKIRDGDLLWHRMGDAGYFDDAGRLWFCGRKSHRVETGGATMHSVPCEDVFNVHPEVARTALVGVGAAGRQRPVLVVEPLEHGFAGRAAREARLGAELLALGAAHAHTRAIRTVLFHPAFPMDVRHNAKIQRERLALWAERRLR